MHVDLSVGGIITLFVAAGLAAFGLFMEEVEPDILPPLLGAAILTAFVSLGLLVAGSYAKRQREES